MEKRTPTCVIYVLNPTEKDAEVNQNLVHVRVDHSAKHCLLGFDDVSTESDEFFKIPRVMNADGHVHVEMLYREELNEQAFQNRVLKQGSIMLSSIAKTRSWEDMENDLRKYERTMRELCITPNVFSKFIFSNGIGIHDIVLLVKRFIGMEKLHDEITMLRVILLTDCRRIVTILSKPVLKFYTFQRHLISIFGIASVEIWLLIDSFGSRKRHMDALIHKAWRFKKIEEVHIERSRNEAIATRTYVVGTPFALDHSPHILALKRIYLRKVKQIVAWDAPTSPMENPKNMFDVAVHPCIDSQIKVALVGNPTQIHISMKLLATPEKRLACHDDEAFNYIQFLEKRLDVDLESKIYFLCPHSFNKRSPQSLTALLSELAPFSLTLPSEDHARRMLRKALSSTLKPQFWPLHIKDYMDFVFPEISMYHSMQMSFARKRRVTVSGFMGSRQYFLYVPLSAASTALVMAVKELHLRKDFRGDLDDNYFASTKEAYDWHRKKVQVHICAPYTSMLPIIQAAVDFLLALPLKLELGGSPISDLMDITVSKYTVDASQGNTYQACVLALPGEEEWTRVSINS